MSIRAVIFDFGGVLVRTIDPSGRQKWEARLGLADGELSKIVFDSEAASRAMLGQVSESAIWEHVASTLRLDAAQLAELERDFWSGDWLDTELVEFLRSLRPRYKTGILSNAWSGAREAFVNLFGLGQVVDAIIISAEEGVAKPDRRIYQIAAGRLGVQLHEAIFVDDMLENAQAAQAAGMYGVQFKNTPQTINAIKRYLDEHHDHGSDNALCCDK